MSALRLPTDGICCRQRAPMPAIAAAHLFPSPRAKTGRDKLRAPSDPGPAAFGSRGTVDLITRSKVSRKPGTVQWWNVSNAKQETESRSAATSIAKAIRNAARASRSAYSQNHYEFQSARFARMAKCVMTARGDLSSSNVVCSKFRVGRR